MKRKYLIKHLVPLFICCLLYADCSLKAQSAEIQQLILNLQKLEQLKGILNSMYKGYEIVNNGYTAIKDISEGNFSLHELFLDELLQVSPVVKTYKRVADIISCQQKILTAYTTAFSSFQNSGSFTAEEIEYLSGVYSNLFDKSLENLNELLMIVTAGSLRMTDDERITAIDRIYLDITDKLVFLNKFNDNAGLLAIQRARERGQVETSRKLYGINK